MADDEAPIDVDDATLPDEIHRLPQIVEAQAHLAVNSQKLAKQKVRVSDASGKMHIRISGQLEVKELHIDDSMMDSDGHTLAVALKEMMNEALDRAQQLAMEQFGLVGDPQWREDSGLPKDRVEVRSTKTSKADTP